VLCRFYITLRNKELYPIISVSFSFNTMQEQQLCAICAIVTVAIRINAWLPCYDKVNDKLCLFAPSGGLTKKNMFCKIFIKLSKANDSRYLWCYRDVIATRKMLRTHRCRRNH